MTDYEAMMSILAQDTVEVTLAHAEPVKDHVTYSMCEDRRDIPFPSLARAKLNLFVAYPKMIITISILDVNVLPWDDDESLPINLEKCVNSLLHTGEFDDVLEFMKADKEFESL